MALLILQKLESFSDRKVVKEVKRNRYMQYFCQISDEELATFMHHSTLSKVRSRLGVSGVEMIEEACFQVLKKSRVIETEDALIDSTVQNSCIIYPNDVLLVNKAFRKMTLIAKNHGRALWWDNTALKKQWRQYNLDRKTPLKEWLQIFYELFKPAFSEFKFIFAENEPILSNILDVLSKQTAQKISGEIHIENRLVSLDDVDARPIKKGKKHPTCEFGTTLQMVFNRQGFLLQTENFLGHPGDSTLYQGTLLKLRKRLRKSPQTTVTDKGFRSQKNLQFTLKGMKHIFQGKSSDVTVEQRDFCKSARSATEGFIAVAKNLRGFRQSRYRGLDGHRQWTVLCQVAYNLKKFHLLVELDLIDEKVWDKLRHHAR